MRFEHRLTAKSLHKKVPTLANCLRAESLKVEEKRYAVTPHRAVRLNALVLYLTTSLGISRMS